jgi:hypothetical protein
MSDEDYVNVDEKSEQKNDTTQWSDMTIIDICDESGNSIIKRLPGVVLEPADYKIKDITDDAYELKKTEYKNILKKIKEFNEHDLMDDEFKKGVEMKQLTESLNKLTTHIDLFTINLRKAFPFVVIVFIVVILSGLANIYTSFSS